MKLALHYLKFDLLRWKWLVAAGWALVPVYVWLVYLFGQTDYTRLRQFGPVDPDAIYISAWVVFGLICLCGLAVCLMAGMENSRVRGRAWNVNRPRHALALLAGRCAFVGIGVVAPQMAAHLGALAAMEFGAANIFQAIPAIAGTVAAAAFGLLLWSYLWPHFPAMVAGVLLTAAGVSASQKKDGIVRVPGFIHGMEPPPFYAPLAMLICLWVVGALALLLWRPRSRLAHIGQGAVLGAALTFLVLNSLTIYWRIYAWFLPSMEEQFRDAEVVRLRATGRNEVIAGGFAVANELPIDHLRLQFAEAVPLRHPAEDGGIQAALFRTNSAQPWPSAWRQAWGVANLRERAASIVSQTGTFQPTEHGELRLAEHYVTRRQSSSKVPLDHGVSGEGNGWNYRFYRWPSTHDSDRWCTWTRTMLRGRGRFGLSDLPGSAGSTYSPYLPFIYLEANVGSVPVRGAGKEEGQVTVHEAEDATQQRRILEISNVVIERIIQSRGRRNEQNSTGWYNIAFPGQTPVYWTETPGKIPEGDCTEAEAARCLQLLGTMQLRPTEADTRRLTRMAGKWPALFLRAVQLPGDHSAMLAAMTAGLPEDQKDDLLRAIPQAPWLMPVAFSRGWAAEARPFFLQLAQENGGIGSDYLKYAFHYRDPEFHPFLIRSFTGSPAELDYWQQMPDLSAELPQLLTTPYWQDITARMQIGDVESLDKFLDSVRKSPDFRGAYAKPLIARFLDTDGRPADQTGVSFRDFIGARTSADFRFDPVRRRWTRPH